MTTDELQAQTRPFTVAQVMLPRLVRGQVHDGALHAHEAAFRAGLTARIARRSYGEDPHMPRGWCVEAGTETTIGTIDSTCNAVLIDGPADEVAAILPHLGEVERRETYGGEA